MTDTSAAIPHPRRLFVTTALPYANGPLHTGHLLEYIQADIWVRAQRMLNNAVHFVCADDAHGAPIMLAAEKAGMSPEAYVDAIGKARQQYLHGFHVQFDNWHSTHSVENTVLAEEFYKRLQAAGMIQVRSIEQLFDPVKRMFLPDRFVKGICPRCDAPDQYGDSCEVCGAVYAPTELKEPRSALTGARPELRASEHLFFQLSSTRAQEFLKNWVSTSNLQVEVRNKTNEWFEAGLHDWDISRDEPYFGIQIPDHPGKYFYVWLDAPIGYLASLKNHFDKGQAAAHGHLPSRTSESFEEFIADPTLEQVHFIGKDIMYFHTLFWPAMLHFCGMKTNMKVYVHGHLTVDGVKMSKSRGNAIDPLKYLELGLDPDCLRYYFGAKLSGRVADVDFVATDFVSRVNSDVIGKFVNIASRASGFIAAAGGTLTSARGEGASLIAGIHEFVPQAAKMYEELDFGRCIREVIVHADRTNEFFDKKKPWALAKNGGAQEELLEVCSACIEAFRLLAICLKPVMPALVQRAEAFLGVPPLVFDDARELLPAGHRILPYQHLMRRVDLAVVRTAMLAASEG